MKKLLEEVIRDALKEVDPANAVRKSLSWNRAEGKLVIQDKVISLRADNPVYVLGSGKASAAMGEALEEILGDAIEGGIIITPTGTTRPLRRIRLAEGSHPLPDSKSLEATRELLETAAAIPEGALVFCLISGGTSALLCYPADGLDLEAVAETQLQLLRSGADIHEMNVVRTVMSQVKGGQLLRYLSHVRLVDLIISDVPGDRFRSIGSGPTTAGPLEFGRARQILEDHGIWEKIPTAVREHIEKEVETEGIRQETGGCGQETGGSGQESPVAGQEAKPIGAHEPEEHHQFLISSARMLADSVAARFREKGWRTEVASEAYNLPIGEVEEMMASRIREAVDRLTTAERRLSGEHSTGSSEHPAEQPANTAAQPARSAEQQAQSAGAPEMPICLIWYGESSVQVTGSGKGGRNQELALRLVRHLRLDVPNPPDQPDQPGRNSGSEKPDQPNEPNRRDQPGRQVTTVAVAIASVGTDGVDGPTDAAGAIVDGETLRRADELGIDPDAFLENNDAWTFFDRVGGLLRTGPTGNNLMDLQIVLVGGR